MPEVLDSFTGFACMTNHRRVNYKTRRICHLIHKTHRLIRNSKQFSSNHDYFIHLYYVRSYTWIPSIFEQEEVETGLYYSLNKFNLKKTC